MNMTDMLQDIRVPISKRLSLLKRDKEFAKNYRMAITSLENGIKQGYQVEEDYTELLTFYMLHIDGDDIFEEKGDLPIHDKFVDILTLQHFNKKLSIPKGSFFTTARGNVFFNETYCVFDNINYLASTLEDEDGKMFGSFVAQDQYLLVLPSDTEKVNRAIEICSRKYHDVFKDIAKRSAKGKGKNIDYSEITDIDSFIDKCFSKYRLVKCIKRKDYLNYTFYWLIPKNIYSIVAKNGIFDCKADLY